MEKVKYSHHQIFLGRNYIRPHALTIARVKDGDHVTFGWSFCIPSRNEISHHVERKEIFVDEKTGKEISTEEYNSLVALAKPKKNVSLDENDGALLVVDEEEEKARERLLNIKSKVNYLRSVTYTTIKGDVFSKRVGRQNALNRLHSFPVTIKIPDGLIAIQAIMDYLRTSKDVPACVREVAGIEYWIISSDKRAKSQEKERKVENLYRKINEDDVSSTGWINKIPPNWRELVTSGVGKAAAISGGILIGYLLSLLFCALAH